MNLLQPSNDILTNFLWNEPVMNFLPSSHDQPYGSYDIKILKFVLKIFLRRFV